MREPEMQDWVSKSKPEEKKSYPLSREMELAIDRFFFSHYCQAFRTGAFARANCSMCVFYLFVCLFFCCCFLVSPCGIFVSFWRREWSSNVPSSRPMVNMCDDHDLVGSSLFLFKYLDLDNPG